MEFVGVGWVDDKSRTPLLECATHTQVAKGLPAGFKLADSPLKHNTTTTLTVSEEARTEDTEGTPTAQKNELGFAFHGG
jgi:hypothetical protein